MAMKIGEKQNQGMDELYCNWYKCPKCKAEMIIKNHKFCPNCGIKLEWDLKGRSIYA